MEADHFAEWVREEHLKVENLSDALRAQIAVVPRSGGGAWIKEVRERFEHFRAHMQKHMALEEHNGYMAAVVDRTDPTMSPAKTLDGMSSAACTTLALVLSRYGGVTVEK